LSGLQNNHTKVLPAPLNFYRKTYPTVQKVSQKQVKKSIYFAGRLFAGKNQAVHTSGFRLHSCAALRNASGGVPILAARHRGRQDSASSRKLPVFFFLPAALAKLPSLATFVKIAPSLRVFYAARSASNP